MIQDNEKIDKNAVRELFTACALIIIALSVFFIILKFIIFTLNNVPIERFLVTAVLGWLILLITERKKEK